MLASPEPAGLARGPFLVRSVWAAFVWLYPGRSQGLGLPFTEVVDTGLAEPPHLLCPVSRPSLQGLYGAGSSPQFGYIWEL